MLRWPRTPFVNVQIGRTSFPGATLTSPTAYPPLWALVEVRWAAGAERRLLCAALELGEGNRPPVEIGLPTGRE